MDNMEEYDVEKIILLAELDAQQDKILEYKSICLKHFKFYNEKGFTLFVFLTIWCYINFVSLMHANNYAAALSNVTSYLIYFTVFSVFFNKRMRFFQAAEQLQLILNKVRYFKKIVKIHGAGYKKTIAAECINREFTNAYFSVINTKLALNVSNIALFIFDICNLLYLNHGYS